MFKRKISDKILEFSKKYKAISLIGPRQSGKTTLAKSCFPDFEYVSLENPDTRLRALEDPRSFLASLKRSSILDEIQNTPDLFSYLQEILDNKNDSRQFILTGSNSFLINKKISQSLAGRVKNLTILPLLFEELPQKDQTIDLDKLLWNGLYPAIYDRDLSPSDWCADYYHTYVQKDLRATLNIKNLLLFDKFIRICAGRIGQLANYSNIGNEVGISQPTTVEWLSVLESSYITFKLEPHFKNFNKRIIKSPKLYFYDTGLLCFLLRISSSEQLFAHPLRGQIFENYIISEFIKAKFSNAEEPNLYFWRDKHGHEIDLAIDNGSFLEPIEIKSGSTFSDSWLDNLNWFNNLQKQSKSSLIYSGEDFLFKGSAIINWKNIGSLY